MIISYPPATTNVTVSSEPCHHCGNCHNGRCPRIKVIEYYRDGSVKRVEYFDSAQPLSASTPFVRLEPTDPYKAPYVTTCGSVTISDTEARVVINSLMANYGEAWQRLADP